MKREVHIKQPEQFSTKRRVAMNLQEWLKERRLAEIEASTDVAQQLLLLADLKENEGNLHLTDIDVEEAAAALWG